MSRCSSCSITFNNIDSVQSRDDIRELFEQNSDIIKFMDFIQKNEEEKKENIINILNELYYDLYNIYTNKTNNINIEIEYDYKIQIITIYIKLIIDDILKFNELYELCDSITDKYTEMIDKVDNLINFFDIDFDVMTEKEHTRYITYTKEGINNG